MTEQKERLTATIEAKDMEWDIELAYEAKLAKLGGKGGQLPLF